MTDGEKARIQDVFKMFQVASAKTNPEKTGNQSIENLMYTFVALTLGWVLEEKVYTQALEEHIRRLRSQGVQPLMTMIEKHKKN